MPQFQYRDLGPAADAIRLLTISPRGKSDQYVWCSLSEVRLSDCQGEYIAISHTWGRYLHNLKIQIDGSSFFVTPQIWHFLHLVA
jgi:hypothetical protein